jgi:hypothetical protein
VTKFNFFFSFLSLVTRLCTATRSSLSSIYCGTTNNTIHSPRMSYSVEFITSELTRWDTLVRAAVREGSIVALMKTLRSPIVSFIISVGKSKLIFLQRKFYKKCVLLEEGPEKAAFFEPYYLHELLLTCGKDLDRPFLLEDSRALLTVFDQPANLTARAAVESAGMAPGPASTREVARPPSAVTRTPPEPSKDFLAAPALPGPSTKTNPALANQTRPATPDPIRPRPLKKATKEPEEDVMSERPEDVPVAKSTTGERWPTAMYKEIVAAAAARRPELIKMRRSIDSASDEDVRPVGFGVLNADTSDNSDSDAPARKQASEKRAKDKGKQKAVDRGGDSDDFEMGELEEEMANTAIVVKRQSAPATTSGKAGARIRYMGRATGELFSRPCKKCKNARVETLCQVDEKGGACVRCKAQKYRCDYAFRPGGDKKSKEEVESEDDETDVQASQSDVARTFPAGPAKSGKTIRFILPDRTASPESPAPSRTLCPATTLATARPLLKSRPAPAKKRGSE